MRSVVASLLLAAALAGCAGGATGGEDRPLVVATTSILGDIVAKTAGSDVAVQVLVPIGADPHVFAPSARQVAQLRDAALVVSNGLGLEEGLEDVLEAAEQDGVRVVRLGELLDPLPVGGPGGEAALDPHVWMDPLRVAEASELIAEAVEESTGTSVRAEAAAYRRQIEQLHAEIEEEMARMPVHRRRLVTVHHSLGYYARRYDLTLLGTVVPAATTEAETSAAGFAALVELMKDRDISVIFGSTTEATPLVEALSAELGREVRVIDLYIGSLGGAGSGAESYLDMMRTDTRLILDNL